MEKTEAGRLEINVVVFSIRGFLGEIKNA